MLRVGRRTLAVSAEPVGRTILGGMRAMRALGITERHGLGVPLRVERQWTARNTMRLLKGDGN